MGKLLHAPFQDPVDNQLTEVSTSKSSVNAGAGEQADRTAEADSCPAQGPDCQDPNQVRTLSPLKLFDRVHPFFIVVALLPHMIISLAAEIIWGALRRKPIRQKAETFRDLILLGSIHAAQLILCAAIAVSGLYLMRFIRALL